MLVADVGNDTTADLIVAGGGDSVGASGLVLPFTNALVTTFIGSAEAGYFTETYESHVNGAPVAAASGDVDGDGLLDVVTGSGSTGGAISVLLGQPGGVFAPAASFASHAAAVAVGEFGGDSFLDVVAVSPDEPDLAIYGGRGDGTFAEPTRLTLASPGVAVTTGDLDGDGDLDLAVPGYDKDVSTVLGDGDGTFTVGGVFNTHIKPVAFAVGDLDLDGNADVIVGINNGTVEVLRGGKSPILSTAEVLLGGTDPDSLALADVTGDGRPDILEGIFDASITVIPSAADGTFGPTITNFVGRLPSQIAAADLNGDGHPEVVFLSDEGTSLNVLLGANACP